MKLSNWIKMITKLNSTLLLLVIVCVSIVSCSKDTGRFGFKTSGDDRFMTKNNFCEFNHTEKVEWVFCFDRVSKSKEVGVVILKKEKVWVNVYSFSQTVNRNKQCIFGQIHNYNEGIYRIVITDKDTVIAEQEFTIY